MVSEKRIFSILILLALSAYALLSDSTFTFGGDNWADQIITGSNTTIVSEEGRPAYISLKDATPAPGPVHDLLLTFDNPAVSDLSGNYTVTENRSTTSRPGLYNQGSGRFVGDGGITLEPKKTALFHPGSPWRDFTMEFWIQPSLAGQGEEILRWTGSRKQEDRILPQSVRVYLDKRSLVWEFNGFFITPGGSADRIILKGSDKVIPRSWSHHMLRYNSTTGLLEYLIDGQISAITYTTGDNHQGGEVSIPFVGAARTGEFIVAPSFNGLIDLLQFSRSFKETPVLTQYLNTSGMVKTRIFDLVHEGSKISSINLNWKAPDKSGILAFYRTADSILALERDRIEWTPFSPGSPLDAAGRYLQLQITLYPSSSGNQAPELLNGSITWIPHYPPVPPSHITATPGNGQVTLNWLNSGDSDTGGYRVYYGTASGQYFGMDAVQGESPVDAGMATSITLEGLENGILYYFAVTTYDKNYRESESEFSQEVTARPLPLYGSDE